LVGTGVFVAAGGIGVFVVVGGTGVLVEPGAGVLVAVGGTGVFVAVGGTVVAVAVGGAVVEVAVGGTVVGVGLVTVTVVQTFGPAQATRGDASTSADGRHSATESYQALQHTSYVPAAAGVHVPLSVPLVPVILL